MNLYVVRFIAVASCLYALLDIRSDLFMLRPFGRRHRQRCGRFEPPHGCPSAGLGDAVVDRFVVGVSFFLKSALRVMNSRAEVERVSHTAVMPLRLNLFNCGRTIDEPA